MDKNPEKYWAFISYSHEDKEIAEDFHEKIENYVIPKRIRKNYIKEKSRIIPKRLYPIFLDKYELSTSPDLEEKIKESLYRSDSLIVLCSPISAKKESYVEKEIIYFKKSGKKNIIPLIISGEPNADKRGLDVEKFECFSDALKYDVNENGEYIKEKRIDPKGADLRKKDNDTESYFKKLKREKLLVIAGILGIDFPELLQRDIERQKNRILKWGIFSLILLCFMIYLFIRADIAEKKATKEKNKALSNFLAIKSSQILDIDPTLSFRLAEAAYFKDTTNNDAQIMLFKSYYSGQFYSILTKNQNPWNYACYSPDNKNILAIGQDSLVHIFDLNGKEIKTIKGHNGIINTATYSPDGKFIITASNDNTARIWDLNGKQVLIYKNEIDSFNCEYSWSKYNQIYTAYFSPDGKNFLIASRDGSAKLINLKGEVKVVYKGFWEVCKSAVFSPDGKYILTNIRTRREMTTNIDDDAPRIWNINGNLISALKSLNRYYEPSPKCVFSKVGQLVIAYYMKTIIITDFFDKKLGEFKYDEKFDKKFIYELTDCNSFISNDNLYNYNNKYKEFFKGHSRKVNSSKFSPDCNSLITTSDDATIRIWQNYNDKFKSFNIGENNDSIITLKFSPDGKNILLTREFNKAYIYNINGKFISCIIFGPSDFYHDGFTEFTNDSKNILINRFYTSLRLYSRSGKVKWSFNLKKNDFDYSIYISKTNYILASNEMFKGNIYLLNMSGKLIKEIKGFHCSFSNNGNFFVVVDTANVCLYNLKGEKIKTIIKYKNKVDVFGESSSINTISFSPDDKFILVSGNDNTAKIIDLSGKVKTIFKGHKGNVNTAIFSPDGKYVLTVSFDFTMRIWDISGKQISCIEDNNDYMRNVSFSPDSKYILALDYHSEGFNHKYKLWDIYGNLVYEFKDAFSATFSPDGKYIATIGNHNINLYYFDVKKLIHIVNKEMLNGKVWKLDNETKMKYFID